MNNVVDKMTVSKSKRIFYFDALRALAIICVILIHVYGFSKAYIVNDYPDLTFDWVFTQIIGNPFRIGVDLFLMLSGALSLGREWNIKSFLLKRIPRITAPFLFWNILIASLFIISSYFGLRSYVTNFDFNYLLNYFHQVFMGNTLGFAPNWFFWMILGTYLIMPIFNKWLLYSDLKEAEYFLFFWLITCLFDNTLMITFPVKLSYFTSPIGLVVLGYYLRHTKRKILNNKLFNIILILIPAILLVLYSYHISNPTHTNYIHRYSILMCLEVGGVFLLFKNIKFNINTEGIVYRIIFAIAKYSYGIYLFHYAVLIQVIRYLPHMSQAPYIIIVFISTLTISAVIMSLLNRIPYLNQIIGAK